MGSVTISVSTLLILLCAVILAVVLALLLVGLRRQRAAAAPAGSFMRRNTILLCVAFLAIAAIIAIALLGTSSGAERSSVSAEATATPSPAPTAEPTATPVPTQVVPALPDGMSQEVLDEFVKYCNDVMYYSNKYIGTEYVVEPSPYFSVEEAFHDAFAFYNSVYMDDEQAELLLGMAKVCHLLATQSDINNPSDYLLEDFTKALADYEAYFNVTLVDLSKDQPSATETAAATAEPAADTAQSDPLSGKIFVTEGSSSGGMYTEGQAFYFIDGRVYVGLPGDSEATLKADSLCYTPYDMYYTMEGNTVVITGGGYTSRWTYDASADAIHAGSTTMTRGN